MRLTAAALIASLLVAACASPEWEETRPEIEADEPDTIEVTSSAFEDGATIPTRFTCDGEDVSPPLSWANVPDNTEEIVIVVEDPDAPGGSFVHWIVAGIDPTTDGLDDGEVPEGAVEGTSDFDETGYRGPCPPQSDDPHRYEFVVYAIGQASGLSQQATADELWEAIAERTTASGTLTAEYGRGG